MPTPLEIHQRLSPLRSEAYATLFGTKPCLAFPYHRFSQTDTSGLVDVLVYPLEVEDMNGEVFVAVTNGMSDYRMHDVARPNLKPRREIIQYLRTCTDAYARRLHDAAWLPHDEGFAVDVYDTISFPKPFEGDLQHSFFLRPIWLPHADFILDLDSDEVSFLWNIPITDQELLFKKEFGVNAFLDRMEDEELPWLFDSKMRPSLLK